MIALGPSWKVKLAGILTPILPVLLWCLLTNVFHLSESTSTEISGALLAGLAAFGLYNAKGSNVSNSPTPLVTPQVVALAPVVAMAPPTKPDIAAVVVVTNPLAPTPSGGHLVEE